MGYGDVFRGAIQAVEAKEIPRGQGTIYADLGWVSVAIHPGGSGYTDDYILDRLDRAQALLDAVRAEAERKLGTATSARVPNRRRARR